jgi:uncharacterized protein (TIGR02271 family)
MPYEMNTARRNEKLLTETTVSTGIPFWDVMLSFGKASQQVLSAYAPRPEYDARFDRGAQQASGDVEVIPVGEETLNVGTRRVAGETTRVRRLVVETPVEQDVALREERVVVERRRPTGASATTTQGILTETAIEMSDSFEVAEVWKSVRVTEEVVLRREVTERHETVRDTVRRDEVVVEQARRPLPAGRAEAAAVRHEPKAAAKPEPAQLAADLKKAAERFEDNGDHRAKASATAQPAAEASKPEQKQTAPQPSKAAEPTKGTAAQNEKSGHSAKG